jgi:hypothetical protein
MSDFYPPSGQPMPPPYPPPAVRMEPDRGVVVLILGILSLVFGCFGVILGPIAMVMGKTDLNKIDRGLMNPAGRGSVSAGRICGIIGLVLGILQTLAILLAIIFPVFMAAREKAKQATCLNQTKQIAQDMIRFAVDHNDTLPNKDRWVDEIQPYVGNAKVLKCVDDESKARTSYAMNAALSGKKLGDIGNPAEVVLLYETSKPGASPAGDPATEILPNYHNRGNDFGYVDGHARWVKAGQNPGAEPIWLNAKPPALTK